MAFKGFETLTNHLFPLMKIGSKNDRKNEWMKMWDENYKR